MTDRHDVIGRSPELDSGSNPECFICYLFFMLWGILTFVRMTMRIIRSPLNAPVIAGPTCDPLYQLYKKN